jgi:hypothetical protein
MVPVKELKSIADNDNITLLEVKRILSILILVNDQNITATQIFINVGARAVILKSISR